MRGNESDKEDGGGVGCNGSGEDGGGGNGGGDDRNSGEDGCNGVRMAIMVVRMAVMAVRIATAATAVEKKGEGAENFRSKACTMTKEKMYQHWTQLQNLNGVFDPICSD